MRELTQAAWLPLLEIESRAGEVLVRFPSGKGAGQVATHSQDANRGRVPRAESEAESEAESQERLLLVVLSSGPLAKSQLAAKLGKATVTGQMNRIVRTLLANDLLKLTIPQKPNSRLQRYRLTAKGKGNLAAEALRTFQLS